METQTQTTHSSSSSSNGTAMAKGTKIAYAVTERNGRSFWNRIGIAFINKDGSINVKLEAMPVTGQLQLRDWEPRDDAGGTRGGASSGGGANGGSSRSAGDHILTELPF